MAPACSARLLGSKLRGETRVYFAATVLCTNRAGGERDDGRDWPRTTGPARIPTDARSLPIPGSPEEKGVVGWGQRRGTHQSGMCGGGRGLPGMNLGVGRREAAVGPESSVGTRRTRLCGAGLGGADRTERPRWCPMLQGPRPRQAPNHKKAASG